MIALFDKKENCCGCTACMCVCPTKAIKMESDEEGFLYPVIDKDLCIECGLCIETCAFQKGYDSSDNYKNPDVYAIKHTSDEVRKNSSSGGAFTAISDYVLSEGGVIYGAAFDESMTVLHMRAKTELGRNKFRGSKYIQSNLNDVFCQVKKDLQEGKTVLFSGTGCQVASLKRYLMKLNISIKKLLLVDIICHGSSSPLIFSDYISYLEKKNECDIKQYFFRSKINGWKGTQEIIFKNGKHDYTSALSQVHSSLYYSNLCLRPSCFSCRYTNIVRPSDITIADYWGVENYFPEFRDSLGVSAVIINTKKGSEVYSEIIDIIESIPSNIEDCSSGQRNLREPTPVNPKREAFWSDYRRNGFEFVIKKYAGYSIIGRLKRIIKRLIRYDQ